MQGGQGLASHRLVIGGCGGCPGTGIVARDHGVDSGVDGIDPGDATVQQFDGREFLGADQAAGRYGGEVAGFSQGAYSHFTVYRREI